MTDYGDDLGLSEGEEVLYDSLKNFKPEGWMWAEVRYFDPYVNSATANPERANNGCQIYRGAK